MIPYLHSGSLSISMHGWMTGAGFFLATGILYTDFRRRGIRTSLFLAAVVMIFAGLLGAPLLFGALRFAWLACSLAALVALAAAASRKKIPFLDLLDAFSPALSAGYAISRIGGLRSSEVWLYETLIWAAIAAWLWNMGAKAVRIPKASGEIFCNFLLLTGAARFLLEFFRAGTRLSPGLSNLQIASLFSILIGAVLLWQAKWRFHAIKKEHRILQHAAAHPQVLQPEYHRPTAECPHPERWHMFDSMTAEVEVLDFLKALVTTIKPELVVETGTFMGISTLRIAEGLKENGFGRVITCEYDPKVFEEAKKRFVASGLAEWIELRNESSLETAVDGRIDLLFCDSDTPLREREVRRFLPQINPHGLIVMHDASSAMRTVREGALTLEREGLISVVFLPTPRGLVLAQKREGRS